MKLPGECRVAYHHSCHLLRELHGHDHPLQLLDDVEGCTARRMDRVRAVLRLRRLVQHEAPRGVGGHGRRQARVARRAASRRASSSADSSCLHAPAGPRRPRGQPDRDPPHRAGARHRGSKARRRDGRTAATRSSGTTLRERTAEATTNVRLRGALARATARFGEHRLAALDTLEDPDGLRRAARAIKADVIAAPARAARAVRRQRDRARRPRLLGGRRRRGQRLHRRGREAHRRAHDREVQVDGDRGDRPQRGARGRGLSTSSRPTSASGSSSSRDHTPSHIIAPAVHLDRYQVARRSCRSRSPTGASLDAAPAPLAAFAREQLRAEFLRADLGISGVQLRRRRDRLDRPRRPTRATAGCARRCRGCTSR